MPRVQVTVDIAEALARAESLCWHNPSEAYDLAQQLYAAIDPQTHPHFYARALRVMAQSGIALDTRTLYARIAHDIPPALQRIPHLDPAQRAAIRAYVGIACVKLYAYTRGYHHIERARLYLWDAQRYIPIDERDLREDIAFAMLTVAQVMQRPDLTRESYRQLITLYNHHGEPGHIWLARVGLWYHDMPLPVMVFVAPLLLTAAVPVWLSLKLRRLLLDARRK